MEYDDVLAHYGVLGMKWGVRKVEASTEKRSTSEKRPMSKKRKVLVAAAITAGVGVVAAAAILAGPKVLEKVRVDQAANLLIKDLKDDPKAAAILSDGKNWTDGFLAKDVVLPSGTKFNRIANALETEIGKNPKYVTYRAKDVANYQASFTNPFRDAKSPKYKTIFDSSKDTRIAGQASMFEAAFANATASSKASGRMRSEIIASYKNQPNFEFMKAQFVKATDKEVADRWLNLKMGRAWDTPVAQDFIDTLKKSGYSGLTDNVDSFGGRQHAVVLIDDSVFKITGRRMTDLDIKAAKRALAKLPR